MTFRLCVGCIVLIICATLLLRPSAAYHCYPTSTPTVMPSTSAYATATPRQLPTRTPVPIETQVAHVVPQATIIAEGVVIDVDKQHMSNSYFDEYSVKLGVKRYYKGGGEGVIHFSEIVPVPCWGTSIPPYEVNQQGVYFFDNSENFRRLSADNNTHTAVQTVTEELARRVYALGFPLVGVFFIFSVIGTILLFRQPFTKEA